MADDDDVYDQEFDPRSDPESSQPWLNLLEDAEKKYRDWQDLADRIDELYADLDQQSNNLRDREFSMFWANIGVLGPSVYARQPVPVVVPMFKDRSPVKITASEMLERSLVQSYQITGIDQVMRLCRDDLLIVARGVLWCRYEDKGEVKADKATQTTGERVVVEFLDRRDFRHSPARTWPEVDWVGRCAWLTREEGRDRFGEKAQGAAYIVPHEGATRLGQPRQGSSPEEKAPFWELWHRGLNKVVWVTEGVEDVLDQGPPHLKLEGFFPCPKPAYGTVQRRTLIPVPDYLNYRDQLEEINKLTARIHALSDAVQVKGFYPGGGELGEVIEAALNINDDRKVMIPVANFAAFGSGGDPIIWMPLDMIATTIAGLIEMRRQIIDDVYQIVGLSDIMRGSTEAEETATAQQLKSQYGSVRIRDKQYELVRVALDATRIVAEIMAEEFSRETLLALSQMTLPTDAEIRKQVQAIKMQVQQGAQQLQQQMMMLQQQAVQAQLQGPPVPPGSEPPQAPGGPGQPPSGPPGGPPGAPGAPPEGKGPDPQAQMQKLQQQAQQALQAAQQQVRELEEEVTVEDVMDLLRNERLRPFALDIETDSTIQPDEDAQKQRNMEMLQTVGGVLPRLGEMVQLFPGSAEFAGDLLRESLKPFRIGRDLSSSLDKMIESAQEAAKGDKPPSPEEIKAKGEVQKMMMEARTKEAEIKARAETEERKIMAEMARDKAKIEADREKMIGEIKIKDRESRQKMLLEQQKHQQEMEKAKVEYAKMQKEMEATEQKIAAGREDQQLRRQAHEQDFSFKEREANHKQSLAERQAAFGEKQGKSQSDGMAQALKALSAPKRVVRDASGRVSGVESINGKG